MWGFGSRMENTMNFLIADYDAAVRKQQAEQQAAAQAAEARNREAAERAKAEAAEQQRFAEEKICEELASKAYEACKGAGSVEELQAIEDVFNKGGNAIEFFKALHPFKTAYVQEKLSFTILNSLINHGLYESGWAEYIVEDSGDAYELLKNTEISATTRKINSPRLRP